MSGIESTEGIDKLATIKAVNSTKIPPEQRNDLRELHGGCVSTQKRQFDCQRAESLLCLFCGEEPDDEEHILWRCPRWETLRREKQGPSNGDHLTWPPCTSRCGIFLEDLESVAGADMGPSLRAQSISCNTLPDSVLSDGRFERETNDNDRSWPGPLEHVSAIRTRGSEEQAVEYSLASTTTEIPSPCLDVSRQTTVQICDPSFLRCKYTMGISGSGQTVNM